MEIDLQKNRIYIAGAVVLASLILLWFVFRPAAVPVNMVKAARTQLLDTIDVEARTSVRNKFTVTAPVSGKLKRIALKEGDYILRNYPISEIDPNPPIPRAPTDPADRPNPYAAKVFAPASGRVLKIFEKSERYLEVGTPLLEIGDPTNIEIVADVLSTDVVRIRPGSTMLIENIGSAEPIRAQVRTIEPQAVTKVSALGVEEKRVNVVADLIDKKTGFGDNFRLDVRIIVWQAENALSVPNSALFRSGNDWNVFVVEGGRAYIRKVETGHRSRTNTEIVAGIEEGEWVIEHAPNSLAEGSRVTRE